MSFYIRIYPKYDVNSVCHSFIVRPGVDTIVTWQETVGILWQKDILEVFDKIQYLKIKVFYG